MKRSLLFLTSLFFLSYTLTGQNCSLSISVIVGECDPNGEVSLGITISDPSDNARDVNVTVDDVLLPGSPFRVRDDEPVFVVATVTGDGLDHVISVVSEDEENCSEQTTISVPDCGSDCFLSGLQLSFDDGITHTVNVGNGGNNTFTPSQTTITIGDIVSFDFVDDGHTTTSDATTGPDSWNSGLRGNGTSFPVTIINPGLHRYYCVPHGGPNGSGMAGSIVANCPGGPGFGLTAAFTTTQAGAAGYNLMIDGQVQAGSPFSYSGTGPQSVAFSLPGDGALHTVEIIDLTDGTCTLSRNITAPDCGQAPTCSLFLSAQQTGFCLPDDGVNIALSVMAVNAGNSGFNVRLDGNLITGSPFTYANGGNTTLDILVPGDGQNHDIIVTDADDPTCSATTSLTTSNCTIPCELTNLTASTGGAGTIHIVDVEDFVFSPRDITVAAGDQVEWRWTGQIAHTATSDVETGPDSWDSGLLNTGATFQSPPLSAGLHPYYCIPHGGPNGAGMAGTITVLPDCTNGEVAVAISFNATGTGAGYNVFVDGTMISGGPFSYDASGTTSTSVFVAGDGQSHTIEVRDTDDASCSVSTTVTTADCNASTCQLTASIEETTGCDANLNVGATLTVNDVGGSANGFTVTVDGQSAGTFAYSGNGATTVTLTLPGDGQSHEVIVTDADDANCTATTSIVTTNCTIPCELTNLTASTGGAGTVHIVDVEDFVFTPRDITVAAGDQVEWRWTGQIAHTATSDVETGPDSWDSGLLNTGATFQSPALSAGLHPYYCIPHGGPNGAGMAGTITVLPDCTNGEVAVAISFNSAGTGAGYNVFVDGSAIAGGPFSYDASGTTSTSVFVAGDGQSHTIEVRDTDDASCSVSTTVTTADCNASTCQLTASIEETTGCDANLEVTTTLTLNDVGGSANGFSLTIDGQPAGTFAYSGNGTTTVTLTLPGDGQNHDIIVSDADDPTCSATTSLTTTNCSIPCELANLTASTGGAGTIHIVDVEDFVFTPRDITVAAGDQVEWRWTGQIAHTATSDVETGPDSWDSGLLNTGATFQSPALSAGLHPYYCIPHGGPNGAGMAGTITVLPDCTNGEVAVAISFNSAGTGAGYNVFVDGSAIAGGPFSYDASGTSSTSVFVAGDGQSHSIEVRDSDDATCSVSTTVTTADCNASTCQLTASIEETTGCDANLNVGATLTVNDVGGSANGFTVTVDGQSAGTFAYSGNGATTVTLTLPGDGQSHEVIVTDADDANCTATTSIVTTNCTIPCELTNLTASTGGAGTVHIVDVEDFVFTPRDITVAAGDQVEWRWTGQIAHTATSDVETGPDSWDSGLLNTGATFQSPPLSAGLHPYYCIPHGGPNGAGMAGTITVLPDCTNGEVAVAISFNATGTGAGYNVFVDGTMISGGPFSYDASGTTSTSVFVAGDGQSHTIEVRDTDDASCSVSTTVTTADCNASTCQLTASIEETTGCNPNLNVVATLTIGDVGGSANGFSVTVDGQSAGTFAYSGNGNGTTTVTLTLPGDGQNHDIIVSDADDPTCSATTSLTTSNCTIPCELTNLTASTGGAGTIHIVDVEDFVFTPRDITIAAGDQVEWRWTGQIAHTATSDAETGPDSWDSGLLNTGATYQSPVLSAGLHNYYCIPHGTPGGNGMAGTITVLPDCTDGEVAVAISFNATGTGAGYNVFVDGTMISGGPFSYDASGTTSTSVFVAGDGQSHTIEVRDTDDASCSVSTTVTTADCNASTCQLTASIEETTGCDANLNVGATLTVNDVGGSANGFTVTVDGQSAGTFAYSGNGATTVTLTLPGDGQSHEVIVTDADDANCTATTSIVTTNCTIPCELTNLTASTGGAGTVHIVDVEDFVFSPRDITVAAGDQVEWRWTGQIAHTATSDVETGPDSWDSGLLNTGATFQSPALSAGLHPYYCIPHGGPNGAGMAGTITVLPDCTNGEVAVAISFNSAGTGAGYNVFVDGSAIAGGPFSYDASGTTSTSVFVAGDGQSHTIEVRDTDDASCSVSTTVTTADCNASTCQLTASIEETTGCDANLEVTTTLTLNDVGGSANGFSLTIDGQPAGTFAYSGNGTTTVTLTLPGDGQNHDIIVTDADDPTCSATTSLTTSNCTIPCELANLTASTGGAGTIHIVDVEDFVFTPRDITVAAGDQVEWRWTGQIAHTATSDVETGPDSWDSGLLNTGATFQSPALSAGLHPYYCIPHGGPNGAGMAGTITVLPDCTNGEVAVAISFNSAGTGAGYNVFVDGTMISGGPFSYDASGTTSTSVFVAGDGQSHSIEVRDTDDASCSVSTTVTTADCNASTCQLTASIEETTGCDPNLNVVATLTIGNVGGSANGFSVTVDGQPAGTFTYSGNGTTTVMLTLPGDGQSHDIIVTDADDPTCSATVSITTSNCSIPCELANLTASTGGAGTIHIVDVEDFVFSPRDITIASGDQVEWRWTGQIAHTATSDIETGPDSWDSGLLNTGATFQSPVLSAGLHPYYCEPHGGPNGAGMAGTITVLPDCTNGQVAVGLTFNATGTGAGYNVFVDGTMISGGPFSYDASGTTSTSVFVAGDGQSHSIEVRDTDDASCSVSTQIDTDLCPVIDTCQMVLATETTGGCTEDSQTQVQLTISNDDPGLNGFNLFVDGILWPDSPFGYVNDGVTLLEILVPAMGQTSEFRVIDAADTSCVAISSLSLPNCTGFCTITDVETVTGVRRHEVAVRDFDFFPRDLSVTVGDTVVFVWTGQIPHTSTSDALEGPLTWESGLLGQGSVYEVVITEPGFHGYYCIPHGGPNGIGMAGSITATENCSDGLVTVPIRFNASMGGVGFRVFLDGEELDSTYTYDDPDGVNEVTLILPGDGLERLLTVQDLTTSFCAVTIPFRTQECTVGCADFTASFTFTPESGFTVRFDGEAEGATDWLWGFGDGATSREENPVHQYAAAGEYRVCLLAQDSLNACTRNYCETITVGTVATNDLRGRTRLLNVYPNPIEGALPTWTISGLQEADLGESLPISLLDINGRLLLERKLSGTPELHFAGPDNLPAGIYLLRVQGSTGFYLAKLIVR